MNWLRERIEAMERFVQADRSDPFTLARCKLHMRNGIAGFRPDMRGIEPMPWVNEHDPRRMSVLRQDVEAFYGATAHTEMRQLPDGREYPVTVYRNQVRP
jgi:hypothetical protein